MANAWDFSPWRNDFMLNIWTIKALIFTLHRLSGHLKSLSSGHSTTTAEWTMKEKEEESEGEEEIPFSRPIFCTNEWTIVYAAYTHDCNEPGG